MIIFFIIIISVLTVKTLKALYPLSYLNIVSKYSNEFHVDESLILSIIKNESKFNKDSVSRSGAKGLMQLMDKTALEASRKLKTKICVPDDLFVPDINIKLGTFYIKYLLLKYNNNTEMAVSAYNAGASHAFSWFGRDFSLNQGEIMDKIKFPETKKYLKKIMRDIKVYKRIRLKQKDKYFNNKKLFYEVAIGKST